MEALHHESPADRRLLDVESVDIELMIVLGICDRRLQHLSYLVRDAATREGQLGDCFRRILSTNHLCHQVQLPGAGADRAQEGRGLGIIEPAFGRGFAHQPLLARLSPAWP